jgi:hypothetical protein
MFNLIKVAAVSVALTVGLAGASQATTKEEFCMVSAETVASIVDLLDIGVLPDTILKLMMTNGVPKGMAEEMIAFTYVGYVVDERPAIDVAYDWFFNCMSEGV